jgi:hypothetical protein
VIFCLSRTGFLRILAWATEIIDLPTGMPAVFANPDAYKPGTPHFKKR